LPRQNGFPLAQIFFRRSEQKFESLQPVLCSLGAVIREARMARRFRFLNWNFHELKILSGVFLFRPEIVIPYPHRVVKQKCPIYREKSWIC
jgi:hypothetical protein